jgi:hypothetical protein
VRIAAEGVRASNSASSSCHCCRARRSTPALEAAGCTARSAAWAWTRAEAAAKPAETRAEVRSRARQKSSRLASPVTSPVPIAASIPAEW